MAQRSYLMVAAEPEDVAVLESANAVPLLWLALLNAGVSEAAWGAGATLRLAPGEAIGITFEREAALGRLSARREAIAAWVGGGAATVIDQFIAFLGEQPGQALRLDISEWVELSDSREQALREVRENVAALDGKGLKRRPPAVKRLLDELGLTGLAGHEPAFGVRLAGVACSGREPWRRDPPRERRSAGDFITWTRKADRHFITPDGHVVATTVTSQNSVETPVLWDPRGTGPVSASEVPDEIGFLFPHRLSADGHWLFCGAVWHPGELATTVRLGAEGLRVLVQGEPPFGVSACSATGGVAAGALYPKGSAPHAAVWRDGAGVQTLPGVPPDSLVQCMDAVGNVLGGQVTLPGEPGQWGGTQAWVWQGEAAHGSLVAEGWTTEWIEMSPDGRRGAIAVKADKEAQARMHHWQAGSKAVPIECGPAGRTDVVFSPDLRCALARTEDALVLWRPDSEVEAVIAANGLIVDPRGVSSAGDWCVATVRNPANSAAAAVLLWERGRGVRRFDAPPSDTLLGLNLSVASPCESLNGLVLFGQWRDSGEPVTWTLRRGFVAWGQPPRPVPAPRSN